MVTESATSPAVNHDARAGLTRFWHAVWERMHRLILGRLYANQGPNSLDRLFLTIQELFGSVNTNALIVGRGLLVSLERTAETVGPLDYLQY
jgi:hypothetical protein